MNIAKTQLVEFSMQWNNNVSQLSVFLDDHHIRPADQVNFLGLLLDSRLQFSDHIGHVYKNVSAWIFGLRQLFHYITWDVLITNYYDLVYHFLCYDDAIWGLKCIKTNVLFRLQNSPKNYLWIKKTTFMQKYI